MGIAVLSFLILASLYHIIVTVVVYGMGRYHPEYIVLVRDGLRLIFCLLLAVRYRHLIRSYLRQTWLLRVVFLALIVGSVGLSVSVGKTNSDMVIGAKYGMQFLAIFLSALFVGQVFAHQGKEKTEQFLRNVFKLLASIIVFGLVRQAAKMILPELFYMIGYTKFGDRVFGLKPPLYYLTGPGGWARLSGIFSGPNNYGYLLVAMFGLWRRYLRSYITNTTTKTLLWAVFALSAMWTMSRGAIIGIFLQIILLVSLLLRERRKLLGRLIVGGVVIIGALSALKRGSTLAHIGAKFGSLQYVWDNPLGYGLGSSGPSIHTGHGTILPENFFIQLMIDIGVPGLILWLLFRGVVLRKSYELRVARSEPNDKFHILALVLTFGFLGLLLEGMFLHVFEDSMVNYWFFIVRGIVLGRQMRAHR